MDDNGIVYPETGEISVSSNPKDLPPYHKPQEFGSISKASVWEINTNNLEQDLKYVPDSPSHRTIQSTKSMLLKDYQKTLADTQNK